MTSHTVRCVGVCSYFFYRFVCTYRCISGPINKTLQTMSYSDGRSKFFGRASEKYDDATTRRRTETLNQDYQVWNIGQHYRFWSTSYGKTRIFWKLAIESLYRVTVVFWVALPDFVKTQDIKNVSLLPFL